MWRGLLAWWRSRAGSARPGVSHVVTDSILTAVDHVASRLAAHNIDAALIGGVAVAMHGGQRVTQDVDFLVAAEGASEADALMVGLGFERLQRSERFGNYLLGALRVDFLYTQGPQSRAMLSRAPLVEVNRTQAKLAQPEDLIGLKLQALANQPSRRSDLEDIEYLLRRFADRMDMLLVRDYFVLFGKESDLDAFLEAQRSRGPGDARGGV